jgi:hypothetical protein
MFKIKAVAVMAHCKLMVLKFLDILGIVLIGVQ